MPMGEIKYVYAFPKGSFSEPPLLNRPEYRPALKESIRRKEINRKIDRRNFWMELLFGVEPKPRLDANPYAIYREQNRNP